MIKLFVINLTMFQNEAEDDWLEQKTLQHQNAKFKMYGK